MACALTGLCTSMLWPGSLMVAAARFPAGGVFIYAMMAAGGDLGASIGSQLVGLVTDAALQSTAVAALAERLALAPEQLCMKLGLLTGMLFPAAAIPLYHVLMKREQPANEAPAARAGYKGILSAKPRALRGRRCAKSPAFLRRQRAARRCREKAGALCGRMAGRRVFQCSRVKGRCVGTVMCGCDSM